MGTITTQAASNPTLTEVASKTLLPTEAASKLKITQLPLLSLPPVLLELIPLKLTVFNLSKILLLLLLRFSQMPLVLVLRLEFLILRVIQLRLRLSLLRLVFSDLEV